MATPRSQTPRRPDNAYRRDHRRSINEALRCRPQAYVGIHPDLDFGTIAKEKPADVVRLGFNNVNGLPATWISNNRVNAIRRWSRKHDVDAFFGVEPNLNWKKMPREGRLPELFRSENALRTTSSFNTHENFGKVQQGGTFGLAFGQLASRVKDVGADETNAGRYSWFLLKGRDGHSTRVVVAYQPCDKRDGGYGTVYQQQRRYLDSHGRKSESVIHAFRQDLVNDLRRWRHAGDRLILFIDANEDTSNGPLSRLVTGPGLNMREAVRAHHPTLPLTPTFQTGRLPIDAVFVTPDLPVTAGAWISSKRCPGDHRGCILELRWKALLGEDLFKIQRPEARRLSCQIPSAVKEYNKLLEKQVKEKKIVERLHKVYQQSGSRLSVDQQQELATLDKMREDAMISSEKKCRKFCMGEIDFSPEINQARGRRYVWSMVLKRRRSGNKILKRKIKAVAKAVGIESPLSATLAEAERSFRAADDIYKRMKPNAPMMRADFLRERSKDETLSAEARKRAKTALRHERARDCNRRMKHVLKKNRANSVTTVVSGEGPCYVEHTDKESVERAIMENNTTKFRLTENTPPMQDPLLSDLGYLADTDAAEQILAGTYECPEGVDEYTRDFLQCLQRPSQIEQDASIDTSISRSDFQDFWKNAKERTSSSMSGLHYGHYKAVIENDLLSEMHAVATHLAVNTGFSYPRWQRGLSCMLEKVAGLILVIKLRAILLMEADFNFANKLIFGRRMMWFAEDNKAIPAECYGSRKHHEAIDAALNRRLATDIFRQQRISAAIASLDLADCYDRIAHNIASLGARRWGVPVEATMYMMLTIQFMLFFLRTSHGDSTSHYGGRSADTDSHPLQGICQGNGGGPAIFLGVCAPCIELLHKRGFAARFRSALSAAIFTAVGLIYVDDSDFFACANDGSESLTDVTNRMQQMALCWHGGTRTTGAALGPSKCSWGIIAFGWDSSGQWHYRTNLDINLQIPDTNGTLTTIRRLEPSEAITVVGVEQALDGNMDEQAAVLEQKANELGEHIKKGYLPRNLVWQSINTMIWPSLRYALPASSLSPEQGDAVTAKLYRAILPSAGTNRHFPEVFCHAPVDFFGLSLPLVKDYQGIEQIKKLLVHGSVDTPTGHFLRTSLESAQLEVGIGTPILEADYEYYGFLLTDCWIKSLWRFVSAYGILLRNPDQVLPQLQRTGDAFLMELFVASNLFDETDLIKINRCRLFYRAVTLADVVTGDGSAITREARLADRIRPTSSYVWPNEWPCSADIYKWREALRAVSASDYKLPFIFRLGPWTTLPHRTWTWFYDPISRSLFHRLDDSWERYSPISSRATRTFELFGEVDESTIPLPALLRASVHTDRTGRLAFDGSAPNDYKFDPLPSNLRALIDSWPDGWPLHDSFFPDDMSLIVQAIIEGSAILVSDGSYKPKVSPRLGSAGWIFECQTTGATCRGRCQTSGQPQEVNPYRSELQGLHAGLLAILAVCSFYDVKEGSLRVGCDNSNGVSLSGKRALNVSMSTKHVDLIRAIRIIVHKLPISVTFFHIDGHQDKILPFHLLDRPAQLNVMMDTTAKQYIDEMAQATITPAPSEIMMEGWSCTVRDVKATTDPTSLILREIHLNTMREFLARPDHLRLTTTGFNAVDWDAVRAAMLSFPQLFRMWASKHMSHFCAVGRMMLRWGFWDHDRCPCCQQPDETTTHLLLCGDPGMKLNYETRTNLLLDWLREYDTHPDILTCFTRALRARDVNTLFVAYSSPFCYEAAVEQDSIGWQNFLEGKVSRRWRDLQEQYFLERGSSRLSEFWASGLVKRLLELTHSQWKFRSDYLHERNQQGLKRAEAAKLVASIQEQFALGTTNLARRDRHYILCGYDFVRSLSAKDQQAWLRGIQIARDSIPAATGPLAQQRAFMESYFMSD